ncbi:MAG TPA: hypothetical protein GXX19_05420 [Syntrophomonadaceae bacterium]|nr:hypothetical protein [Syntrophomonadaceae bacterium]
MVRERGRVNRVAARERGRESRATRERGRVPVAIRVQAISAICRSFCF